MSHEDDSTLPESTDADPPSTSTAPQPTGVASWNPALRRNSEAPDSDDEFFDRYPGATPKKQQPASQSAESDTSETPQLLEEPGTPTEEYPSYRRPSSISVQYSYDVQHLVASEDELRRVPSNHVEVEGPRRMSSYEEEDEEALTREPDDEEGAILQPDDSEAEQRQALEEQMPDQEATQDVGDEVQQTDHAAQAVQDEASEHYEHQGEITELEEAIEPSADIPLMEDESDLPTPGFMSREPTLQIPSRESTLEFDGAPAPGSPQAKSPPVKPQMDRSFTTNFLDSPVEAPQSSRQQRQQRADDEDWPSVGDDKTFGELLDNEQQRPTSSTEAEVLEQVAAHESAQISSPDQSHAEMAAYEHAAARESEQIASEDNDLLPEDEGEVKEEDLAAAWGAALDDDELLEETPTDADLDPSQFFSGGNDDDGFLEDEPAPIQQTQPQQQQRAPQPNQYRPNNLQQQPSYGVPSTGTASFFDPGGHGRSAGTPSTGLDDLYSSPSSLQQQQPQSQKPQRPSAQTAQSFVDKAKGGYQSPYDLPMDVVKPRRRPQPLQQSASAAQLPAAPPRSSSMNQVPLATGQQGVPPRAGTVGSVDSLSPPQSSHSTGQQQAIGAAQPTSAKSVGTPKTGGSGFFEDLPMSTKPRARPAGGPYTPGGVPTAMPMPPPSGPVRQGSGMAAYLPSQQQPGQGPGMAAYLPSQQQAVQTPPVMSQQQQASMFGGLTRPQQQMPLLPDQPPVQQQQAPQAPQQGSRYSPSSQAGGSLPAPPAVQSRYSPAPGSTGPAPPAGSRYSPAPGAQPTQSKARLPSLPSNAPPTARPFAPRTSSPLAAMQTDKPHPPLPSEARGLPPSSPPRPNAIQQQQHAPPEPRPSLRYAPTEPSRAFTEPPTTFAPPQRPRTQSPDATMKGPRASVQFTPARPSSSAGVPQQLQQQILPSKRPVLPHRRQFSQNLTFAAPTDSRSLDPLERWKGHPIFNWSPSGTIISSFPKQTPFYAAGQGIPSVKCTPGAITVQDATTFMPMTERDAKFPGPLTARSKRQKKDVLAWLAGKIEDLERQTEGALLDFGSSAEVRKRVEEKLVLWKIVRVFVEHDGVLEGNPKIEEEVRRILLPNLAQMAQVADLQSPVSASLAADPVDKQVLFQIRQALLEGQRERAVWLAEEKKLWGHAMLIASTMGPDTWKQIVGAFVRSQVKSVGSDARSTAALYQIFAGNVEECVDELVPPSARAGFQMINKASGTVSGNPLEGMDQWRETLGLITSNRTASDGPSLLALGKLLAGYGRVEAAHTCFLFARQIAKLSGADDAEVHFVLLGANHQSQEEILGTDLDSILLTEVFEYASSLSAPSTAVSYVPHLQAFKLVHAQELAAHGLKAQAQAYCDHITSAYTSTTRPSPYYHPTFTQAVADFSAFLSQTPHDGKAGFFSKPAMNKVSSGAASWFSKFVAGDEDHDSNGASGHGSEDMAGPFGRVNGESPALSRTESGTDLYNPMMGGAGVSIPGMGAAAPQQQSFAPSSAPGRYAPSGSNKYAPGQPHTPLGMPAAEPQRPSSSRYAPAPNSSLGVPRPDASRRSSDHSVPYLPSSRRGSAQDTSSQGSYEPRPILADESSAYSYSPSVQSPLVQATQAPAVQEPEDAFPGPNGLTEPEPLDAETGGAYLPPSSGYEPPSYGYQPYEPEPDSPEETRPRKTFGDDDNDAELKERAAALKKAQADRAADDAFRKAAEADAEREDKKGDPKKGWLTGWWGGKKDPDAAPGPIRAKLGEESSFYYDENLKKWVNKKGGPEAATPVAATPPPPRGPASRVASTGAMGPPSGPPSRAASGTPMSGIAATSRPPTSGSGAGFSKPPSGPPSGPPSRTGTPASDSAPPAGGVNGDTAPAFAPLAPPVRPGSSLSTASSIDDLLAGPPGARKGGTVKGKKKGGRYVDVMAK
ncbi:vesicle coat component [Vermiconidia calcicola]|uniref:Vesicle coat component n=1 Tax=Vermiconidia calcicola TaxID=1690605 RepID=A0ACC3NN85_9PEZI|nr:vesicle coat component [Vermiconidia calcicola]